MKKASLLLAFVMFFATIASSFAQDRKISSSAKGAVIGGLGGAAAGALINKKNRVVGGAVGGAAGGAIGYTIGRNADNKRRAEAARVAAARRAEANRVAAYRAGIAKGNATAKANNSNAMAATAAATAAAPTMMNSLAPAASGPSAFAMSTGYLPNESYGDRNAAYPSSEVRRKSW
ncbi:glycine zipper 2TM domain-containing protein [Microvirga sp. STR05]|uniref:Glycine zipper 2TM domain-containing protein n=2 Tax=Hymenobacter TaxID=89966 RepID=A0A7G7W5D9_9BACT|nr:MULTISPECIES: glycine zipper 2TM domain-containing protein [Hymenobacter]MBD2715838.1 glycine zipper 2TM domain-containing protein [Hymenobacter duratus]MBR7950749.1 glycine zipper 2TM domain-containing protein [Microvirga sp. STR05]QNH61582.1 glycine zipper 2TM domain-containing protein [Hymenobacter sediminicola]